LTDELFRPTIEARPAPVGRPWRPASIVYPAFFGGPLAAVVLGLLNGRRLALGRTALLGIAAAGAAGVAGRLMLTAVVHPHSVGRLLGGLAGLLVWLSVLAAQKRPFRAYELRGGEPAGLVGPGLAAVAGCGLLEVAVLVLVVRAVTG
jgi:hypothetical protein